MGRGCKALREVVTAARTGTIALIRPNAYIAWADSDTADDRTAESRTALARWCGSRTASPAADSGGLRD
jgi:hypothetical protein